MVIDHAEILGFSYEDGASGAADHSIYEVAMRALEEGNEGEKKMTEEKKVLEEDKAKFEKERKEFDDKKAAEIKEKEEAAKKTEEETKAKDVETQKADHEKIQKELEEKTEALKKATEDKTKVEEELNKAKGVVGQQTNPNAPAGTVPGSVDTGDPKFYEEKMKEISAAHNKTMETLNSGKTPIIDERMKGFAELTNLQHQADDLTADLSDEDKGIIRNIIPNALRQEDTDIVLYRTRK